MIFHSNSVLGNPDCRMIDSSVPVRNSRGSGIGTVVVHPSSTFFCIMMWLPPLRRASVKPCCAKIPQASRPDSTRSLANRDLNLGYVHFIV